MKNFETHYPVAGSSALKSECIEIIIDFPDHCIDQSDQPKSKTYLQGIRESFISRIMQTEIAQDLLYGSIQGKSFNTEKKWQSLLAGTCFFALAIACIYFGR